jgi:hypothetical protein
LLSILGGFLSGLIQARRARRVRLEELTAERMVQSNAEAYGKMKRLQSLLQQSDLHTVAKAIQEYELWFWDNRLFLFGRFSDKFLGLRAGIFRALRLGKQLPEKADELSTLESELNRLVAEAIQEICKEMDVKPLDPEIPMWSAQE